MLLNKAVVSVLKNKPTLTGRERKPGKQWIYIFDFPS